MELPETPKIELQGEKFEVFVDLRKGQEKPWVVILVADKDFVNFLDAHKYKDKLVKKLKQG